MSLKFNKIYFASKDPLFISIFCILELFRITIYFKEEFFRDIDPEI